MTTQNSQVKSILRISILTVLFGLLATPLIVGGTMYFPFIVGKGLFIKALVQILVGLYVVLMVIDPASRPKKSLLTYSLIGFVVVAGISNILSVSPFRSFWSNFERMEGYSLMLHLGALFVVASSTIRKREWAWLAGMSLFISAIVGFISLGDVAKAITQAVQSGVTGAELETLKAGVRISGPLGNSSYLGVYALMHAFVSLLFVLMVVRGNREAELLNPGQHKPAKRFESIDFVAIVAFTLLAIFNLYILYKTGTRGSFAGLIGGVFITSIYLAWKEKNKILKYIALGVFSAMLLCVVSLGIFKNSEWVQSKPQLARYASLISFDVKQVYDTLGGDRKMIWGMALEGIKEKPLFGWGQDNFGQVFAKHYDPNMYAREHWFDRSHNVFLDWWIAAGTLGLLAYLSFFVFAAWLLFSKKTAMTIVERAVLLGLLTAYFIHNLFVFDNLTSYILFFLLLAYIHDRNTHDRSVSEKQKGFTDEGTLILGSSFAMVLVIGFALYTSVFVPLTQNLNLAKSVAYAQQQGQVTPELAPRVKEMPVETSLNLLKQIYDAGRPTSEVFEQVTNIAATAINSPVVSEDIKMEFYKLATEQIQAQMLANPGEPRYPFFATNFHTSIGDIEKALLYAEKAYSLSPKKQSFAYALALLNIRKGEKDKAVEYVRKAYQDAPENSEAFTYYVSMGIDAARKTNNTFDLVVLGGVAQILADGYKQYGHDVAFDSRLWAAFKDVKQPVAAKALAKRLGELIPEKKKEFETLANLAK